MKNVICSLAILFVFSSTNAQKEFWSFKSPSNFVGGSRYGEIVKTDFNGENPVVMHQFDSTHGSYPAGRLFQASNGKLYGVSHAGGFAIPNSSRHTGFGVLFEYDPVTEHYKVLTYFGTNDLNIVAGPLGGVIETSPGVLFGPADRTIFKHVIATGVSTQVATVPNFTSQLLTLDNSIKGGLMKASNGLLYGTTHSYSACPQANPYLGSIARLNPANNAFALPFPFECYIPGPARNSNGYLIEGAPGKLYGTSGSGGLNIGPDGTAPAGSGTLFEYDIATNKMTIKFHFDYRTTGSEPGPLVAGANNKLYGVLTGRGKDPSDPAKDIRGSLFEYDLTTGAVTVLHYFEYSNQSDGLGHNPRGSLLKGSDGNFYGVNSACIFKFDPIAGDVTRLSSTHQPVDQDLIEICRKPAYQYIDTDQFIVCTGSPFSFDLHNTNADSYQWRKDGQALPGQTSGILTFAGMTLTDAGTYTCEMQNECGTTVTMPLQITVKPATSDTVFPNIPSTEDVVNICPGTTLTLAGNDHQGTWNTGQTTATVAVTNAGDYHIVNNNTCGKTYSNIVHVRVREVPAPIVIAYDEQAPRCQGARLILYGNDTGGVWQDGSTASTYTATIDTAAHTDYYVTLQHTCGTITSNVIRFGVRDTWDDPIPKITPEGAISFCNTEVYTTLNSNAPLQNRGNVWTWYKTTPFLDYVSNDPSVTITEPGTYVLRRTSYCFDDISSEPITISIVTEVPATPNITAHGNQPMCPTVGVILESDVIENIVWSTGETTASITVHEEGAYNVSTANGCGTSTGWANVTAFLSPSTVVTINDQTLTSTENNAMSYQWYNCSADPAAEVPGAIAQSFTTTKSGSYAVKVMSSSGCEAISNCYAVVVEEEPEEPEPENPVVGTEPLKTESNITLHPNPARDRIILQTNARVKGIAFVDVMGKTVMQNNTGEKVITISALPSGCYIVVVQTVSGVWRGRFARE